MTKLRLILRAQWDRAAGGALVLVGAGLLLAGYLGVSGSDTLRDALSYLVSGGLFGVTLIAAGLALFVCADLHDEWRKLDRIEAAIRDSRFAESQGLDVDVTSRSATTRRLAPTEEALAGSQAALAVTPIDPAVRRTAVAGVVALALAWTLTWAGFARTTTAGQLDGAWGGIAVAFAGIALAVLASGVYPARLRVAIMRRRSMLFGPWSSDRAAAPVAETSHSTPQTAPASVVFIGHGQTRFHRAHCVLLAGREVTPVPVAQLDRALLPCGICDPE